jgi:hypothetical protein
VPSSVARALRLRYRMSVTSRIAWLLVAAALAACSDETQTPTTTTTTTTATSGGSGGEAGSGAQAGSGGAGAVAGAGGTGATGGMGGGGAEPGSVLWAKRFGDASIETVGGVALDAAGNIYLAGTFYGGIDFGGGALANAGDADIFVAKLAPDGSHLWSVGFGSVGSDHAVDLAYDADHDRVIVAGYVAGDLTAPGCSPTTVNTYQSAYVAAFDGAGSCLASLAFCDSGSSCNAKSVAVMPSGAVFVTGGYLQMTWGSAMLDAGSDMHGFVGRLDPMLAPVGAVSYGGAGLAWGSEIAPAGAGSVVAAGMFEGDIDFGSGAKPSAGGEDAWLVRLDVAGPQTEIWSHAYGGTGDDTPSALAPGGGGFVVGGAFEGTVDFGGGPFTAPADTNEAGFVLKLDGQGSHQWSKAFDHADVYAAAVPSAMAVLVAGTWELDTDLGGGTITAQGSFDGYLVGMLGDGTYAWSTLLRSQPGEGAYLVDVAADPSGGAVAIGYASGTVDVGGTMLTSAGGYDIFVVKVAE